MGLPQLIERDEVLALTRQVTDDAVSGRGGVLFVVGEAGLGKTSVIEWADANAGPGLLTVAARGHEMEAGLPFGVLVQVIEALGLDADELPGGTTRPPSAVEPVAPHYHVLRQLEHWTGPPVLLLLDDLQWADLDSLSVVEFLARRLRSLPVGMIAALRPWPDGAHAMSQRLLASEGASVHRLQPLTPGASATLLETNLGTGVDATTQHRAWTLCRGNPLLVEQLALALARGEALPIVDGGAPVVAGHLLLARFAGLDRTTTTYVRAASVLGMRFLPDVAAAASELDVGDVDHALEVLFRSGLVIEGQHDELCFSHPLLAQALYEDVAPPVRRRLHARYTRLLADRGLENEAAEHAVRGGLVGDERAAALLERTGRAALAAGAVATATRYLESAVRLHGDRPAPDLVLVLAQALTASGRMSDAGDTCQALLRRDELGWEERVAALRLLGRARYFTGALDHGEQAMEQATALAEANDPSAAIEPLLDQSLAAWLSDGTSRALPLAARARELAAMADPRLREVAAATWGHLAYESGDPAGLATTEGIGVALRGSDYTHLVDPAELAWPWAPLYQYAMNANYAGRYDESMEAFARAGRALERAGAVNALATVAVHLANVAIRRGNLGEALQHADRGEEFADLTPTVLPYVQLVRAEALVWSGRFDESEACCQEAFGGAGGQWYVRLWVAAVRGMRLFWDGAGSASDEFLAVEEVTRWAAIREPCHLQWQAHAVAAHLAAGRTKDARRVLEWLEWAAATLPCTWPSVAVALGRARIAASGGDAEGAAEGYRHALALLDGGHLPLHRAETLLALGSLHRREGQYADARSRLAEAVATAEAAGAAHLAGIARDELILAGGRRRRRHEGRRSRRPSCGWHSRPRPA